MISILPTAILHLICSEWIGISDLVRLDSAICSRRDRDTYLNVVQQEWFVINITDYTDNISQSLSFTLTKWLTARKIRASSVYFISNFNLMDCTNSITNAARHWKHLYLENFSGEGIETVVDVQLQIASQLNRVQLPACHSFTALRKFLLNSSPQINTLHINDCRYELTPLVINHLSRFQLLKELNLSRCVFTDRLTLHVIPEACPHLTALILNECYMVHDPFIELIANTYGQQLVILEINQCEYLTDDSMESIIRHMTALTSLGIARPNRIKETLIQRWAHESQSHNLKHLNLSGYGALDANIIELIIQDCCASSDSLGDLDTIEETENEEDDRIIFDSTKGIQTISLGNCHRFHDRSLIFLAEKAPNLKYLDVTYCSKISDAGMLSIINCCQSLQYINVSFCNRLTDLTFCALVNHCVVLQTLICECCALITDAAIIYLSERLILSSTLQELNISGCTSITDIGILAIAAIQGNLRKLSISDNHNITDLSVYKLVLQARKLHHLNISYCSGLTDECLHEIQQISQSRREVVGGELTIHCFRYANVN
jgi:hypothetical protein